MTHVFEWCSIWLISVDLGATMVKRNVLYLVASFSRSRASDVERHPFISDRIPLFHFTMYRALLRRHCYNTVWCLTFSSSWVERNAEFPVSAAGLIWWQHLLIWQETIVASGNVEAARIEIPTSTCYSLLLSSSLSKKNLVITTSSFETIRKTRVNCEKCW